MRCRSSETRVADSASRLAERVSLILKLAESLGALDDETRSNVNFAALHVALENAERSDLMADPRLRALWDQVQRRGYR